MKKMGLKMPKKTVKKQETIYFALAAKLGVK